MTSMTDLHFDSGFERGLYAVLDPEKAHYHPDVHIAYTIVKSYEPDWYIRELGREIFIEAKGRFRDAEEARKYIEISKTLTENQELVFILQNPNTKMPNAKKRKDGSFYVMSDWCDKHGFKWYTAQTLPQRWRRNL